MTLAETRYAIYFVPGADTALYRFGAAVLGYDGYTGVDIPLIGNAPASWRESVQEPRKYGFHATLKAPFRLAEKYRERDLVEAFPEFAARQPAVPECALELREVGDFIALTPVNPPGALGRLARACVEEFDDFRAPLSEKERARRLRARLSARQIEQLDRWGYPYIFEDFRFHLTLTGPLSPEMRSIAFRFLCEKIEQMPGARSLVIDRIAISRQLHSDAPFQVIRQVPLGGI